VGLGNCESELRGPKDEKAAQCSQCANMNQSLIDSMKAPGSPWTLRLAKSDFLPIESAICCG
jgi:hypothetical protein